MSDDRITLTIDANSEAAVRAIGQVAAAAAGAGNATKAAAEKSTGALSQLAASYTIIASAAGRYVDALTEQATEGERLAGQARAMGLDFDQAAASAGRFSDETDALGAASEFAARDIRLTQTELNALERVAGSASAQLGITAEEGVQRLTAAMIRGNERGLAPFGAELVATAGHTHTMQERLAALVEHAGTVAPATDTAADAVKRMRDRVDDASRTFATAFTEGLTRMGHISDAADTTANRFEVLDTDIRTAGDSVARWAGRALNGVALIFGGVAFLITGAISQTMAGAAALGAVYDRVRARNFTGLGAAASSAYNASVADSPVTNAIGEFLRQRANAAEDMANDTGPGAAPGARGAAATETAADRAARLRRGAAGGAANDNAKRLRDLSPEQTARLTAEADRAYEEKTQGPLRRQRALDEEAARNEGLRRQSETTALQLQRAEEERVAAAGRYQRSYEGYASTRGTADQTAAEQGQYAERYDRARTFTERWEELHRRQLGATRELAEGSQAAFQSAGAAYSKHLDLVRKGEETFGDALRNGAADILGAIGERMGARAGEEFAEGLASLASPITLPFAPLHFAAAAAFTAGAVGFGAASSAVHTSAPTAGAGGGGAPQRPLGLGASNDNARGGVTNVTINYGSSGLIMGTPREVAEHLGRIVNDPTADFVLSGARVAGGRR